MKGLNDYLFDEQREKEKVMDVRSNYRHAGDSSNEEDHTENNENDPAEEIAPKKFNKYDLIANSRNLELYVIDKEAYLKNMLTFTSDKSIANKYLDELVRIGLEKLLNFSR